jgi:hypothetical protein
MNTGMSERRFRSTSRPASVPLAMPPQIPRPPFQTANGPHQCGGTSFQLVTTWYSRPPTSPAGKPQSATSCTSWRLPPLASHRRVVSATAASAATT